MYPERLRQYRYMRGDTSYSQYSVPSQPYVDTNAIPLGVGFMSDENHGDENLNAREDWGGPCEVMHMESNKVTYEPYGGPWAAGAPTEHAPGYTDTITGIDYRFAMKGSGGRTLYFDDMLPNLVAWPDLETFPGPSDFPDIRSSVNDLTVWGTESVKVCRPNKPSVNLGVSIGELFREGLPSLIGSTFLRDRSSYFRNLGSEYLNVTFGWKPFVNDLLSVANMINRVHKTIDQHHRDAGQVVRRNRRFTHEDEVWEQDIPPGPVISAPGHGVVDSGLWHIIDNAYTYRVIKRTWRFSGSFSYYVPAAEELQGLLRFESDLNRLLGTRITPEVLWNLAPWTWLLDWFANFGDIISNFSSLSTGELVMHYGYVSETVNRHETRVQDTLFVDRISSTDVGFRHSTSMDQRSYSRIAANPFGFGLSILDLNQSQMFILGALGLSRSPRRISLR